MISIPGVFYTLHLYRVSPTVKVAVNTIVPRSPFFAFCTPKYRLL